MSFEDALANLGCATLLKGLKTRLVARWLVAGLLRRRELDAKVVVDRRRVLNEASAGCGGEALARALALGGNL